jgi:hypothetical protein
MLLLLVVSEDDKVEIGLLSAPFEIRAINQSPASIIPVLPAFPLTHVCNLSAASKLFAIAGMGCQPLFFTFSQLPSGYAVRRTLVCTHGSSVTRPLYINNSSHHLDWAAERRRW